MLNAWMEPRPKSFFVLARDEAVRLQLPEAQQIEQIDLNSAMPEAMSDPLLPTEPEAPEVSLRPWNCARANAACSCA
jgi:hypothetical protein